jgi:hypothetical protein
MSYSLITVLIIIWNKVLFRIYTEYLKEVTKKKNILEKVVFRKRVSSRIFLLILLKDFKNQKII